MGKSAFNNPTLGEHDKCLLTVWTQGNLDINGKIGFDPSLKVRSIVTSVGENLVQTVPKWVRQVLQEAFGSCSFSDIRRVSNDFQQVAHRINQNMAFASIDFLASVEAMLTTHFGCLHTLAVNNCQTRLCLSSGYNAHLLAQGCVNRLPGFIPTPLVKMVVHTIKVRILFRQISPLTPGAQHIQNRIYDCSQLQLLPDRSLLYFSNALYNVVSIEVLPSARLRYYP